MTKLVSVLGKSVTEDLFGGIATRYRRRRALQAALAVLQEKGHWRTVRWHVARYRQRSLYYEKSATQQLYSVTRCSIGACNIRYFSYLNTI